jgi:DNA polymerase-1
MRATLVLTVHDELLFEAPDDEVDAAKEIVAREMAQAYELEPPLEVDVGVGLNWTDAK